MAYNPFNLFRRNMKIFMAVIVVFVMIVFILQFGQGDFFSSFPRWLSAQQSAGEPMAVLNGGTWRESDLTRVNAQRTLANQFMVAAARKAEENAQKGLNDLAPKLANSKPLVTEFTQARQSQYIIRDFQADLQTYIAMMQGQLSREEAARKQRANVDYFQGAFAKLAEDPAAKADDKDAAKLAQVLLRSDLLGVKQGGQYFANLPNRSGKDQLEFVLWEKKADQLGLKFTRDDVEEMIETELKQLDKKGRAEVAAEVLRGRGTPAGLGELYEAVGDEFRVRAAQTAVIGLWYTQPMASAPTGAPFDFYQFYRERASEATYGMIAVPTDLFVAKVTGEPTDAELRAIFAKAQNTEPDPESPKPGLKELRKLKAGWAEVTGKEPFYAAAATDAGAKAEVAAKLAGLLAVPFGPSAASVLAAPGPLALKNTFTDSLYAGYVREQHLKRTDRWTIPGHSPLGSLDTTAADPRFAVAFAGLLAGSFATGGTPATLAADPLLVLRQMDKAEHRTRLAVGMAAFVAPTLPGPPALAEAVGGQLAVEAGSPVLKPEQVRARLAERARNGLLYKLAQDDLRAFEAEAAKLAKDPDAKKAEADAKAYVEKFVKERGLKAGASADFADVYAIGSDPGLQPLYAVFAQSHDQLTPVAKLQFGRGLFFDREFNQRTFQQEVSNKPATSMYVPFAYPEPDTGSLSESTPVHVVWRTEERKAAAPPKFDAAVRPKVVALWKQQKARELAKAAADEWAKEVASWGTDPLVVDQKMIQAPADFAAKHFPNDPAARTRLGIAFSVPGVAEAVVQPGFQAGAYTARPFQLTPGSNVQYPTFKMQEALVSHRNDPVGTALVLADRPESTLYLAVLKAKAAKDEAQFANQVYRPPVQSTADAVQRPFAGQFELDAKKQAYETAVALLKADFGYDRENPKAAEKADRFTGE